MLSVPEILDVALGRGEKITAIRSARMEGVDEFYGYWNGTWVGAEALDVNAGLKEAKDHVESLMVQGADAPHLAQVRIRELEGQLYTARNEAHAAERRADTLERQKALLRADLDRLNEIADDREARLVEVLNESDCLRDRVRHLEDALIDHVLGKAPLPSIGGQS